MNHQRSRGFTIIELLVVVSIIALLVGILLPAIGKAREQARLTQSQANMRNLSTAHATYGAEWNDRQFTLIQDNIAQWGDTNANAFANYHAAHGGCGAGNAPGCHPPVILGWADVGGGAALWGFWMNNAGNHVVAEPIRFEGGQEYFGSFRVPNAKQFNQYVSGRFFDPVFYAPKDKVLQAFIEPALDNPAEYTPSSVLGNFGWSSYCLSPAAMFSPDVLGRNRETGLHYTHPYEIDAGFRSPALSQALYPTLKTQMLEHHWLQQNRSDCNPAFTGGTYNGCEPYYFNAAFESAPVAMFYDGHIESIGARATTKSDARVIAQGNHGLWSRDTPFGTDGYFQDLAYDWTDTSFHILTVDGIKGRDWTK